MQVKIGRVVEGRRQDLTYPCSLVGCGREDLVEVMCDACHGTFCLRWVWLCGCGNVGLRIDAVIGTHTPTTAQQLLLEQRRREQLQLR